MANENNQNESKEQGFLLVPTRIPKTIAESNSKILSILTNENPPSSKTIGDYISEEEAKKLLGKKTTWFWNMRTSGKLASSKIGGTNYYSKAAILQLLERGNKMENSKEELQKIIDELNFELKTYIAKSNVNSFYIEKQKLLIKKLTTIMKYGFLKYNNYWNAVEVEMEQLHKKDPSLVGFTINFPIGPGNNIGFINISNE